MSLVRIVKPLYFESPSHRRIASVLVETVDALKKPVTWGILQNALKDTLSKGEYHRAHPLLVEMRRMSIPLSERTYIIPETDRFCKLQAMGQAIIQSVDLHRQQKVEELEELFRTTLSTGVVDSSRPITAAEILADTSEQEVMACAP